MKELPKPLTKQDPVRWDFSQEEIEKMMYFIDEAIYELKIYYEVNDSKTVLNEKEYVLLQNLKKISIDWQRKIDWNRERGYWK